MRLDDQIRVSRRWPGTTPPWAGTPRPRDAASSPDGGPRDRPASCIRAWISDRDHHVPARRADAVGGGQVRVSGDWEFGISGVRNCERCGARVPPVRPGRDTEGDALWWPGFRWRRSPCTTPGTHGPPRHGQRDFSPSPDRAGRALHRRPAGRDTARAPGTAPSSREGRRRPARDRSPRARRVLRLRPATAGHRLDGADRTEVAIAVGEAEAHLRRPAVSSWAPSRRLRHGVGGGEPTPRQEGLMSAGHHGGGPAQPYRARAGDGGGGPPGTRVTTLRRAAVDMSRVAAGLPPVRPPAPPGDPRPPSPASSRGTAERPAAVMAADIRPS